MLTRPKLCPGPRPSVLPPALMPAFARLLLACCFAASLTLGSGCANREYITPNVLIDISANDPEFKKLRVYPNQTFIALYSRMLGEETGVSGTAGTVELGVRGKRIEVPVKRKSPGAIVALDELEGQPVLWVSFQERCVEIECAFGFIQSSDGLFRLFQVPTLTGYAEASVYRKRPSPRKLMERSKIYSKSDATRVYFTVRGFAASVALEIKKRKRVDIETVIAPQEGVRPRGH